MEEFVKRSELKALRAQVALLARELEEMKARLNLLPDNREAHFTLPQELRLSPDRQRELDNLCREGWMTIADDQLVWNHPNATLLAFVCGRLWGGDGMRRNVWRKGKKAFPSRKLEEMFGKNCLKQKRNKIFYRDLTDQELAVYGVMKGMGSSH